MCNKCPTVGEAICGLFRCFRCEQPCENRCDNHRDNACDKHDEKPRTKEYECFCREKQEEKPCEHTCPCGK